MTAFLGFCHVSGGDAPSQLIAAAFCADRPEFEALVGAALAAQGYRLDWAEDVLPAGPWVARHPSAGGAALARLVHEGRHVALGPMTPLGGVNAPQDEAQDWLHVEEIGPITPLDAQFGVHPKKSVPDALHDALFGQPEPSEAERAALSDAPPPLVTYAVLDAAKMPYLLTSLLDSSGLRYQSLFQGAAQEELGEHAPYLVELKDGHDFTRRLFTGPDGVGGLWDKELGIFIRSRAGFDALRKHLRKFTRVQDEDGKWFYFRFWEKSVWAAVLSDEGLGKHPIAVGFLAKLILLVPKVDCRDAFLSLRYSKDFKPEVRAPVLDRHLQSALNAEIDRLNELGEIKAALSGEALGHMTAEDRYEMMKSLRFWLIEIGFGQSDQRLTAMRLLIDKGLLQGNPWPQSLQQMLADPSRGIGVRLWLLENKDWM